MLGRDACVYLVGHVQPHVSYCSTVSGDGGGNGHRVAPESYPYACLVRVRCGTRRWWAVFVLLSPTVPRRNWSESIQNSNSPINPVCLSFTWISFFILLLVLQSKHCKINHCKSIAMDSLVMLARRLSNLQILYLKDWHVRKILN